MDKTWYYVAFFFLLICLLVELAFVAGATQKTVSKYSFDENVPYKNHITGLNVGVLVPGNYSYQTQITNPYDNMSVKVYSFLFSDPEDSNATIACSVKNCTKILPLESLLAFYDLTVYSEAEYYIRVGCLLEGQDF